MKQRLDESEHSMKAMWLCGVFAVLAIILLASGVGAGALFIIPCMLMMGVMMWMMLGGQGGSTRGPDKT